MKTKTTNWNRILSLVLVLCMLISVPNVIAQAASAEAEAKTVTQTTKVADPSTMDAWKSIFGADVLNTENAGGVWTDKSVFENAEAFSQYGITLDDEDNFLVALSVIASNKSVSGLSNVPTDTMLVLDLSSSMYPSRNPATVNTMVEAVNATIKDLQALNIHNRVGVTVYFGGETLWESKSDSSKVLLPLDRYTHSSNAFLKTTSGSNGTYFESVDVNSGVKNSANVTVTGSHSVKDVAGTFAQLGILDAMNQFLRSDIDTKIPANAEYQAGVTRVPVIMLMSDGEPTAATNNYTVKENSKMGNNQVKSRNPAETDFVTQLTAAYAKEKIDAKYVETTPLFYTLSLGNSISMDIMDPESNDKVSEAILANPGAYTDDEVTKANNNAKIKEYWNTLMTYGSVNITVQNYNYNSFINKTNYTYNVSKTMLSTAGEGVLFPSSINQKYYVDESFTAENASDLADAFKSIVDKIALQSRYFPTLVEGDEDLDGYVTFTDNIGKYMSVTDIKGIIIGDALFSGADLSSNFVESGGSLGTGSTPTELGQEMVKAVQARLGIDDMALAETLIFQAYNHGQLSYTDASNFSNYIGWYANAQGEFLGFWYEGIETMPDPSDDTLTDATRPVYIMKSYGYLGQLDEEHGISKSDMMYAMVQVRENIVSGEQTVIFSVPASLVPMTSYDITLDENGNLSEFLVTGATGPMRLVYEVGLNEEVNDITINDPAIVSPEYIKNNTNADGSVNFYTNQYEVDNSMGYGKVNTFSYFKPSHQNEKYYFQENTYIYEYINGEYVKYTGDTAPDVNGTYYQLVRIYSNENGLEIKNSYRKLSTEAVGVAEQQSDGSWYVPIGTVHVNLEGYTIYKTENLTNTLTETFGDDDASNDKGLANVPFVDIDGHKVNEVDHTFVVGATLGNNGVTKLYPATGIKINKLVEGTDSGDDEFTFTVSSADETDGSYKSLKIDAEGNHEILYVSFKNGVATVSLKADESIIISGLDEGKTYVVSEVASVKYILESVNGNKNASDANLITVSTEIVEATFVNATRGTGDLTVTKTVEHQLGVNYQIPDDKAFEITVSLSGVGTQNATFKAEHSGDSTISSLTTDENGKFPVIVLKNDEQIEFFDLPVGVVATVVETTPPAGFTPSYRENNVVGDGIVTIVSTPTSVEVVNTYDHGEETGDMVKINGTKYLNDEEGNAIADWGDAEFTIVFEKYVNEGWVEIDRETVNNSSRTFSFNLSTETYDAPGMYSYQIYELVPEEKIEGMYYDRVYHTFSVVVSDEDMAGGLEISRIHSEHSLKEFTKDESGYWVLITDFTNVQYNTVPAVVEIPVQKVLVNNSQSTVASLAHHEFGVYTDVDCTVAAAVENGLQKLEIAPTDGVGEAMIDMLFDKVGEYTFYIKEIDKGVPGMIYDAQVVRVDVSVTSEGVGGKLIADVNYDVSLVDGEIVFTNKYDLTAATVELDVRKTIDGRPLTANDIFTFEIRENGDTILVGQNDETGKVTFNGTLEFYEVGVYNYTVIETSESGNGITVDKTVFDVKITVYDGENGKLLANVSVAQVVGNVITFKNKYETTPAKYTLRGIKELAGKPLLNDEFTFTLTESDENGNEIEGATVRTAKNFTDGHFSFGEFIYYKEGEHYYVVSEVAQASAKGIIFDERKYIVKVTVSDNGLGALIVEENISLLGGETSEIVKFVNEYSPDPTTAFIPGIKFLEGKVMGSGQFEFVLIESDSNWNEGNVIETVKNSEDGRITFSDIEYETADSYYYLVKEVYDELVVDGITYDDTVFRVRIDINDDLKGTLHSSVHIYDEEGTPLPNIEFVNKYAVTQGENVVIKGTKVLVNKELKDGDFTFILKNLETEEILSTVNENGTFEFVLEYTADDLGKVFLYELYELKGEIGGIIYDGTHYDVKVTVDDDGKGGIETTVEISVEGAVVDTINFTNTYDPVYAEVYLEGVKELTGRDLENEEFTFALWSADENWKQLYEIQKVKNNEDGSFRFRSLAFTEEGKYYYTVKELYTAYVENGVLFDENVYRVMIEVTDNGEGALVPKTYLFLENGTVCEEIKFVNEYYATYTETIIEGTKELTGKNLSAEEFSFAIISSDENWSVGEVVDIAKNDANGKFSFVPFNFSDDGTYYYLVKEVYESAVSDGITYDDTVYKVTVVVTDDLLGNLWDSVTYEVEGDAKDEITFYNKYSASDVTVTIGGTKELTGRDLVEGEFTFEIYEANDEFATIGGKAPSVAVNSADGSFVFDGITFQTAGVYHYVVVERENSSVSHVVFDKTVYCVTVTVEDDGKGKLIADVSYISKEDGIAVDAEYIVFKNIYTPPATPGDDSPVSPWMVLMFVSVFGFATVTAKRSRKESDCE